jgi:dsDNA-specific endonuclease/ATPase MutS2
MSSDPKATAPKVQVSWGELIDKITILEIKKQRLKSAEATANVRRELATLVSVADAMFLQFPTLASLKEQLKLANEALWDIEDMIRAKEAAKTFDQEFIELARSVYFNNDARSNIKRRINSLVNSELVEEKHYTSY